MIIKIYAITYHNYEEFAIFTKFYKTEEEAWTEFKDNYPTFDKSCSYYICEDFEFILNDN